MKRLLPALLLYLAATFGASSPAFAHAASTSYLILDLPAAAGPVAVRWDLSLHDIVWVVFIDADYDGNVWILPSTTTQAGGGLLYDVVNRKGEVALRVRLPDGRALEGFGPNGTVYLTSHGPNGARVERAHLK